MVNAPQNLYDIHFTLNTTEAINIAASGISGGEQGGNSAILISILEHNSNDLPWRQNISGGVLRIYADKEGFIDSAELERILEKHSNYESKKRITLLAFTGASNVTGSCNRIKEITGMAHRYGVRVLVDAAQLIAHRKIDMEQCGIDFLVFSGHKVYAPFGTGVLIARKGLLNFSPERVNEIRSSGEENLAGIAALSKSLSLLQRTGMDVILEEEQMLLKSALDSMTEIEGIKIHGINSSSSERFSDRGPVIAFSLKKVWPDKIAIGLANNGIGIRYGCHCAHLLVKNLLHVGPALERFQFIMAGIFSGIRYPGVARVSFGIGTSKDDIDNFVDSLKKINEGIGIKTSPALKSKNDDFAVTVKHEVFG
jgi:selenocysteine lyase/cysteine desulfurase